MPPSLMAGGALPPAPGPQLQTFTALIDTGATATCISPRAANSVGLRPLGKVRVRGAAGIQYHNYYAFHVGFPSPQHAPPGQHAAVRTYVFHLLIQGSELAIGPVAGFDVLLGMDVIGSGSLAVEGIGTFSFSF
jgi:hypothetical protein